MPVIDLAPMIRERKYEAGVDRVLALAENAWRKNLLAGDWGLSSAAIEQMIADHRPRLRAAVEAALAEHLGGAVLDLVADIAAPSHVLVHATGEADGGGGDGPPPYLSY